MENEFLLPQESSDNKYFFKTDGKVIIYNFKSGNSAIVPFNAVSVLKSLNGKKNI